MDENKVLTALLKFEPLKNNKEIEEKLPLILSVLNYEEKVEFMADILCEEWYLITHHEYIKVLLDVFAKTLA